MAIDAVIVSVREISNDLYTIFQKDYKCPVYQIPNTDGDGICKKYNLGIIRIPTMSGWTIFSHDDAFLCCDYDRMLQMLYASNADVVGVAGNTDIPPLHLGYWGFNIMTSSFRGAGYVIHKTPGTDMCHVESYGPFPQQVAILDGVWMAVRTEAFKNNKLRFDEIFDGYHFYDADFCAIARSLGYKISVAGIPIYHSKRGRGVKDPEFDRLQEVFYNKWIGKIEYYNYNKIENTAHFIKNTSAFINPNSIKQENLPLG